MTKRMAKRRQDLRRAGQPLLKHNTQSETLLADCKRFSLLNYFCVGVFTEAKSKLKSWNALILLSLSGMLIKFNFYFD